MILCTSCHPVRPRYPFCGLCLWCRSASPHPVKGRPYEPRLPPPVLAALACGAASRLCHHRPAPPDSAADETAAPPRNRRDAPRSAVWRPCAAQQLASGSLLACTLCRPAAATLSALSLSTSSRSRCSPSPSLAQPEPRASACQKPKYLKETLKDRGRRLQALLRLSKVAGLRIGEDKEETPNQVKEKRLRLLC